MTVKILVADDEPDYRNLVRMALEPEGFSITEAENGTIALEKMYDLNPDLLLLDINMPGMNGYAVCQKVRKDPAYCHLPIIMLTVKKTAPAQTKGLEIGADDYIIKPFQPEELVVRIKSLLERSS